MNRNGPRLQETIDSGKFVARGPLGQQLTARKQRDKAFRIKYDKLGGNRILQNNFKLKWCREELLHHLMVLHGGGGHECRL